MGWDESVSEPDVSWTAAGNEVPRRFRAGNGLIIPGLSKAVSPLRSATAVHDDLVPLIASPDFNHTLDGP